MLTEEIKSSFKDASNKLAGKKKSIYGTSDKRLF